MITERIDTASPMNPDMSGRMAGMAIGTGVAELMGLGTYLCLSRMGTGQVTLMLLGAVLDAVAVLACAAGIAAYRNRH